MEKSAPTVANPDLTLVITKEFSAPRERVFDAWLDPKVISQWIGPRSVKAETQLLEPRVGGRYRIFMRGADGKGPTVGGTYREIKRPERLVFTWAWDSDHPHGHKGYETLVTLTFRAVTAGTEMTMRHEIFETKESRDSHNQGWNASFEKLAELL
jgi:uncharacterized protein YndB with AHSA1/START domain